MLIPVAALFFQPLIEDTSEAGKRPAMLQGPPGRRPKSAKEVNTDISKNASIYVLVNGKPFLLKSAVSFLLSENTSTPLKKYEPFVALSRRMHQEKCILEMEK